MALVTVQSAGVVPQMVVTPTTFVFIGERLWLDFVNTDDLRRAMNRAGRLSSDHDKANLLLEVASTYSSDLLRGSYFDALNTIDSDHDRRRVLAQVIEESGKDSALLAQAGRSIERISSDHDKAELLKLAA